jgi:tRNA threonylcarbamoyl adenosine modification protein (Sua5/YciO/YrdC/YwlC family)
MTNVDAAVAAVRQGGLAIIPTDTVYGLVSTPYREEPVRRLSAVKGRSPEQPIAIVTASVDWLLECIPELRGRAAVVARSLLPGPYTLVLPNPARRFPWLGGSRSSTIGVRVPQLTGPGREVLERVGAVAATSANLHGGLDPTRLEDVPLELRSAAVVVDAGRLPGRPSTVVDLTGPEACVTREGAVAASEALARVQAVLADWSGE